MAARLPPSQLPPPPARQLGPWSPHVGRGAHAVRSETLGLEAAAGLGVVDKSGISWQGEEGSEGQRGPGATAPAQAPLLSAPMGSMRLEGISVEEAMVTRTQLLEEELSSLKEELALCQVSRWPPAFPLHSGAGAGGEVRPSLSAFRCVAARAWDPPTSAPRRSLPAPTPSPAGCSGLEGGGRTRLPDPGLLPFSGHPPGRLGLGPLGRVLFTWIPTERAVVPLLPQSPSFSAVTLMILGAAGVECSPRVEKWNRKVETLVLKKKPMDEGTCF